MLLANECKERSGINKANINYVCPTVEYWVCVNPIVWSVLLQDNRFGCLLSDCAGNNKVKVSGIDTQGNLTFSVMLGDKVLDAFEAASPKYWDELLQELKSFKRNEDPDRQDALRAHITLVREYRMWANRAMRGIFADVDGYKETLRCVKLQTGKKSVPTIAKRFKTLFSPMRAIYGGMNEQPLNMLVLTGYDGIREAVSVGSYASTCVGNLHTYMDVIDGLNLISFSMAKRLASGDEGSEFHGASKNWHVALAPFKSFTGRLYVQAGFIKGQFLVMPDALMAFRMPDGSVVQYDIIASEMKSEMSHPEMGVDEFLISATMKPASAKDRVNMDLQKMLVHLNPEKKEFRDTEDGLWGRIMEANTQVFIEQIAERSKAQDIDAYMEQFAREDGDYENLSQTTVALALAAKGMDMRALPPAYTAIANECVEGNFDIDRVRIPLQSIEDHSNDVVKMAFTGYPIPHLAPLLRDIAKALGAKNLKNYSVGHDTYSVSEFLTWCPAPRTCYVGEKLFRKFEPNTDICETQTAVTRRPASPGSVSMLTVQMLPSYLPREMSQTIWVEMSQDMFQTLWANNDGGDLDDKFEFLTGRFADLSAEFLRKKSEFAGHKGEDILFFFPTFPYPDAVHPDMFVNGRAKAIYVNLENQYKGVLEKYMTIASNPDADGVKFDIDEDASCLPTADYSNPCEGWTGMAANFSMWLLMVHHSSVRLDCDPMYEKEQAALIRYGLSVMLSDIVDADVQSKNVAKAAQAMAAFEKISWRLWEIQFLSRKNLVRHTRPLMVMHEAAFDRLAFTLKRAARPELDAVTMEPKTILVDYKNKVEAQSCSGMLVIKTPWHITETMECQYVQRCVNHVVESVQAGMCSPDLEIIRQYAWAYKIKHVPDALWGNDSKAATARTAWAATQQKIAAEREEIAARFAHIVDGDYKDEQIRIASSATYKKHVTDWVMEYLVPMSHQERIALVCMGLESFANSAVKRETSYNAKTKRFSAGSGLWGLVTLDDMEIGDDLLVRGLYHDTLAVLQGLDMNVQREVTLECNANAAYVINRNAVYVTLEKAQEFASQFVGKTFGDVLKFTGGMKAMQLHLKNGTTRREKFAELLSDIPRSADAGKDNGWHLMTPKQQQSVCVYNHCMSHNDMSAGVYALLNAHVTRYEVQEVKTSSYADLYKRGNEGCSDAEANAYAKRRCWKVTFTGVMGERTASQAMSVSRASTETILKRFVNEQEYNFSVGDSALTVQDILDRMSAAAFNGDTLTLGKMVCVGKTYYSRTDKARIVEYVADLAPKTKIEAYTGHEYLVLPLNTVWCGVVVDSAGVQHCVNVMITKEWKANYFADFSSDYDPADGEDCHDGIIVPEAPEYGEAYYASEQW